jgi:hypothetical protein
MLFDMSNTSTDQEIFICYVHIQCDPLGYVYTLSNEIKILLIIIDHKRHITMCIMTPK